MLLFQTLPFAVAPGLQVHYVVPTMCGLQKDDKENWASCFNYQQQLPFIEHIPCSRHDAKYFTYIISSPSGKPIL